MEVTTLHQGARYLTIEVIWETGNQIAQGSSNIKESRGEIHPSMTHCILIGTNLSAMVDRGQSKTCPMVDRGQSKTRAHTHIHVSCDHAASMKQEMR